MISLDRLMLVTSCLLVTGFGMTSGARAQQIGHEVDLLTVYQPTPVILTISNESREIRRILLRVQLDNPTSGTGLLQLDASTCLEIDGFGETDSCRPGIYAPEMVTLRRLRTYDQSGKKRWLFQIDGAQVQEQLFLVVPTCCLHAYRLVAQGAEGVTSILTLERGKPGPSAGFGPSQPQGRDETAEPEARPAKGDAIEYSAFARSFPGVEGAVVYVVATCSYPHPRYRLFFQYKGKERWVLMERRPILLLPEVVTYYIASGTTGQASNPVPRSIVVVDAFGQHKVDVHWTDTALSAAKAAR